MSKKQFSRRRNSLVRIEVDKILYSASESVASQILSAAMPANGNKGSLELWEIETADPDLQLGNKPDKQKSIECRGSLSFELKRRSRTLTDDLISLLLESLRDAFGTAWTPITRRRGRSTSPSRNSVDNVAFIRKGFAKVYEVLRHLVG